MGEFQGAKIVLIFWFCLMAIWLRFRHGVKNFYYVPAPGKRVALYRDWMVMLLCRPFFKNVILHWHAAGLAKWLETSVQIRSRAITYRLFQPVDLSIVLSRYNFADAEKLLSHRICVVNNGIPDPCPDFEKTILPRRLGNLAARKKIFAGETPAAPVTVTVLFLAHCTREKGIFAAAEAVLRANRELAARRWPMNLHLVIAGNFVTDHENSEFERLRQKPEFAATVEHLGFVSGERKTQLLRDADLFLFPTRYLGENQPVNLIEAMAFGLPAVTTRWRSLPEMLPPDYPGLVNGQNPDEIAATILKVLAMNSGERVRRHFREHYTLERHLADLAAAIHSVENKPESVLPRVNAFAQAHLDGKTQIQRRSKIAEADLCYSIADQNVATTKSIGIYNFSVQLARTLSERAEFRNLTVLSNRTISSGLHLSPGVRLENHDSAIRGKIGRILWDQRGVYQKARATRLPWLFLPKGFCSFSVRPPVHVAAYVHDVMGDFYHRRYPGFWPKWESLYFGRSLAATFRHARVIFTNTEFSKSEMTAVAARMGLSPRKIVVAGYGFDARTAGPVNKENRVVLFASQWPHKRTDIALRFLNCWLRESHYDGIIDCIGIFPPEMEKPAGPNWNWIGRVPPAQGREMMRRARAIVYVSEYEGFGMPPMEAILEGTCPVFSDIPALREVMNGAGHSFSNDSEESFARAMQAALSTPPQTIRAWSEQLFQRHNWHRVVDKILPELSEI